MDNNTNTPIRLLNARDVQVLSENVQETLLAHKHLRAGQALFNCLYDLNPELANRIRGTQFDPFYKNDRIKDFFKAICDESGYKQLNPKFKE